MGNIKVTWTGLDKAVSRLTNINAIIDNVVDSAVKNATEEAGKLARGKARVDTGFMRDNIETNYPAKKTGVVLSAAKYSAYLEFGTRFNNGPYPFVKPAVEEVTPKYTKEIHEALGKAFRF